MSFAITVYVTLMPFMSALAPSQWLPLPLIYLLGVGPFVIARGADPSLGRAIRDDAGFLVAFFLGCVGMAFSPVTIGAKNLNYAAAMLVTYMMFFCIVRSWIGSPRVSWRIVSNAAHVCLTLLSVAVIAEFLLASFYGIYFSDLIPFAHDDLPVAQFITEQFRRPRAFAAEPGFTALAYESLWPLTMIGVGDGDGDGRRSRLIHLLYACGFTLLGSAAAIVCICVAAFTVWLVRRRSVRALVKISSVLALVTVLLATTQFGREAFWSIIGRKLDVVTAIAEQGGDAVTLLDRLSTYSTGVDIVGEHPMGIGWGSVGQAFATGQSIGAAGQVRGSGMLSLYLDVAVASGLAGIAAFAVFIVSRVVRAGRSQHPSAGYVMLAVVAVALHHTVVTELQYPFLWFSLAMCDKLSWSANLDLTGSRSQIRRTA